MTEPQVIFDTYNQAQWVLGQMYDRVRTESYVSVADYLRLADRPQVPNSDIFGWNEQILRKVQVVDSVCWIPPEEQSNLTRGWVLTLPRVGYIPCRYRASQELHVLA